MLQTQTTVHIRQIRRRVPLFNLLSLGLMKREDGPNNLFLKMRLRGEKEKRNYKLKRNERMQFHVSSVNKNITSNKFSRKYQKTTEWTKMAQCHHQVIGWMHFKERFNTNQFIQDDINRSWMCFHSRWFKQQKFWFSLEIECDHLFFLHYNQSQEWDINPLTSCFIQLIATWDMWD